MYIITGLGRCGTSILIKYLNEVGFAIGLNNHWNKEIRAGYELSTFYSITDWMHHNFCKKNLPIDLDVDYPGPYWGNRTYREALQEFDKDERQGKVEVVKDPRISWHPDLIEAIYEARPDIKLLICHRDIKSICESRDNLSARYDDPKPRCILSDYQIDFAEFFTRVLKLDIPYRIMFFPNFLKSFEVLWGELNNFGLYHDFNKGKEIWNKIIDKSLLK
jgi:hypothetical protein